MSALHLAPINTSGRITGTDGNDSLDGTDSADTIKGGAGNDQIDGLGGDDLLYGGAGDDKISAYNGQDTAFGGAGNDTLEGLGNHVELHGGLGNDYLSADGPSTVDGGKGFDSIFWSLGNNYDHDVDLSAQVGGEAIVLDPETVLGGVETGTISFGGGNDRVLSGGLDFDLFGGGGGDTLVAGNGSNRIYGQDGADVLDGGAGDDLLDGGKGIDTVSYADASGGVQVNLSGHVSHASGAAGADLLYSIEGAIGSDFNDVLTAHGRFGQEHLDGGAGDDVISAGKNLDVLTGGAGMDVLKGGANADTFMYLDLSDSTASAPDLITDLESGDVINLQGVDANANFADDQAFILVAAFSGQAGELTVSYDASADRTVIAGDVDGDGTADLVITASGNHADFTNFAL
jgi:Ca2+-binding RTX toxin-like protein